MILLQMERIQSCNVNATTRRSDRECLCFSRAATATRRRDSPARAVFSMGRLARNRRAMTSKRAATSMRLCVTDDDSFCATE